MARISMKLTPNQAKEIKIVEWFIPENCDWSNPATAVNDTYIGISEVKETTDGASSESAYFSKSERGKFPETVSDKARLRALLWGKVWRERHLHELYMENGLPDQFLQADDFRNEPDYIREFIYPRVFGLPGEWSPSET